MTEEQIVKIIFEELYPGANFYEWDIDYKWRQRSRRYKIVEALKRSAKKIKGAL